MIDHFCNIECGYWIINLRWSTEQYQHRLKYPINLVCINLCDKFDFDSFEIKERMEMKMKSYELWIEFNRDILFEIASFYFLFYLLRWFAFISLLIYYDECWAKFWCYRDKSLFSFLLKKNLRSLWIFHKKLMTNSNLTQTFFS